MRLLVFLFLVGCATANIQSFHEALDEEADYVYQSFMLDLEESDSLKEALGVGLIQQAEDEIKTELGKRLRKTLDEILEKIKESVDNGKVVKEDLMKKLKETREKLREMKEDLGNKAKEMMEKLKDKIRDFWKDLFDFKKKDERSIDDEEFMDFNIKEMFKKLKESLLSKIDKEKLKARIEEIFGKGSEMADSLLEMLNKKGDKYKQKLLDLVDRYLGKDDEKRSISEYWEKIKEYFKDLHIELKEKYMKFGEWVKENFKKTLDKSKSKMENIKEIAREFIDHTKGVSKEVAVEALEFLRPYKEDLGSLWKQIVDTTKDIINKNE